MITGDLRPGLLALTEPIGKDLRSVAGPILEDLANELGATSNLVLQDSAERVRAAVVIEPSIALVRIAFRQGQIHPLDRRALGLAILSTRRRSPASGKSRPGT